MTRRITWTILLAILVTGAADLLLYRSATGDDLYPPWYGSQQLLLHGRNPYGTQVTQEIQQHLYGRVPTEDEIKRHLNQQRFAYPAYVAFLLTPLLWIKFEAARHITWLLLALATFSSMLLWIDAMHWNCPHWVKLTLSTAILFSPISQRGLAYTQLALLIAFLCAYAVWSLVNGHLVRAGIIMAIATIKPQMAIVLAAWLVIWAISRFRERKAFLIAFFSALSVLVLAAMAFSPRWIPDFLAGLIAYRKYTSAPSALGAVIGKEIAPFITIPIFCVLGVIIWKARHADVTSLRFAFVTASSLAVTAWAVPAMWDSYNQVLMLPCVFLVGALMRRNNLVRS